MIKLNGQTITPTIFPDGTSQVWKLPDGLIGLQNIVEWEFESESELIQVCQLGDLLGRKSKLYMPFLPYGRQDKEVSNTTTFALHTFSHIISKFFSKIKTLDAHSPGYFYDSIYPSKEIKVAIESSGCTEVCFPDKGAKARYDVPLRTIVLDKKRNQLSGEIEGLVVESGEQHIRGANILIIDDICDGGRTFIEAAKVLYNLGASTVNLYTTHGIYSKALDVLREAGIKEIYNRKGKV